MRIRFLAVPLLALLAGGCASNVPVAIRDPIPGSPSLAEVRKDPVPHLGTRVRWGGVIVAVHNREDTTRIEVVGRKLDSGGRPTSGDATAGRFLAEVAGFLDPAVYAQGREITVVGTLAEPETRKIGEFPYRFPVVRARAHYLWPPKEPARDAYPPPWYYDPWYPYHSPYSPYW